VTAGGRTADPDISLGNTIVTMKSCIASARFFLGGLTAAVLMAAPGPPAIGFTEQLIMGGYTYPFGICAADLDGDGDLDLTSADALPHNHLYWFENDGRGSFTRHFIQRDEPERLERHQVGDITGDGFPDDVIVQNLCGDLEWFENSGHPRDEQLWRRHMITSTKMPGAYDVALADFDGDGDLDVAASGWTLGNQFAWFENPGPRAGEREWTKHSIEENLAETRTVRAADFDRDGDPDLLGTASGAGLILWYENAGKAQQWRKHEIASAPRALHGQPVDMNRDGWPDVVMAEGMGGGKESMQAGLVAWYENSRRPGAGPWKRHVVRELYEGAFEAVGADLDGDRDVDIVATGWGSPGRIAWFENPGDTNGPWTMHMLKDNGKRANQVIVADLDGDHRLDIAAVAERGTLEFRWWRNEGRK
jgi:hypothetical protein